VVKMLFKKDEVLSCETVPRIQNYSNGEIWGVYEETVEQRGHTVSMYSRLIDRDFNSRDEALQRINGSQNV